MADETSSYDEWRNDSIARAEQHDDAQPAEQPSAPVEQPAQPSEPADAQPEQT